MPFARIKLPQDDPLDPLHLGHGVVLDGILAHREDDHPRHRDEHRGQDSRDDDQLDRQFLGEVPHGLFLPLTAL
jgi:hypothetical protein